MYGAQSSSSQFGSHQFNFEVLPPEWAPPESYHVPEVEAPYYVSEPPEQGADYVQEPVQVRREPSDDQGNIHDDIRGDGYDHDHIREATVSYETDTVRHRAFDV